MARRLRGPIVVFTTAVVMTACGAGYQHGPAGSIKTAAIVDLPPARERYLYVPPPPATKLHAQRIQLRLEDARAPQRRDAAGAPVLQDETSDAAIEVSLHREFQARVESRLAALVDGEPGASTITLVLRVEHVLVSRRGQQRTIAVSMRVGVTTERGQLLRDGLGSVSRTLSGPPFDAAELDALHLGACLEALDAALSPEALEPLQRELELQRAVPLQASL